MSSWLFDVYMDGVVREVGTQERAGVAECEW